MIRTRFTELFGIEHPVMSAPMGMHSGGTLAAAVSAAGGMGSFGGMHVSAGPEWTREQCALVRSRTDKPYAVGFITPFLPMFEAHLEATIAERPDAIALSFADPAPWAARVKEAGIRLICQVQTLAHADEAMAAGADVLVAQGNEAGGHTGTMGMLPLLAAVATRHPEAPLLAAGGIGNGTTLAAALVAGADGAWLGSAFLATPEAIEVGDAHKQAIVGSDGTDTVFTRAYDIASGFPWPSWIGARMKRNAFTDAWTDREPELRADPIEPEAAPLFYGQSAAFIDSVRPAAEVVQTVSVSAERALRERSQSLLG